MLKVSLDEGYIFDILSIYGIKTTFADTEENRQKSSEGFLALRDEISEQIGMDKVIEILRSKEYHDLVMANLDTFKLVDKARSGVNALAKKVDDANMARYHCKVALQKRFFDSEPVEIKTK